MDINAFSIKVTAEPNCEVRTMKMTTCSNQGQNWTGKEYKIVPKHDEKPIETPRGFIPPAGYTPPEGYKVGTPLQRVTRWVHPSRGLQGGYIPPEGYKVGTSLQRVTRWVHPSRGLQGGYIPPEGYKVGTPLPEGYKVGTSLQRVTRWARPSRGLQGGTPEFTI